MGGGSTRLQYGISLPVSAGKSTIARAALPARILRGTLAFGGVDAVALMIQISPPLALLLGCIIGLLAYGPVKRWVMTLRLRIMDRDERSDTQRKGLGALLLIFATLHPAPWLLLIGIPYGIYRVWGDPQRGMWLWVLAGLILGPLFLVIVEVIRSRRTTRVSTGSKGRPPRLT